VPAESLPESGLTAPRPWLRSIRRPTTIPLASKALCRLVWRHPGLVRLWPQLLHASPPSSSLSVPPRVLPLLPRKQGRGCRSGNGESAAGRSTPYAVPGMAIAPGSRTPAVMVAAFGFRDSRHRRAPNSAEHRFQLGQRVPRPSPPPTVGALVDRSSWPGGGEAADGWKLLPNVPPPGRLRPAQWVNVRDPAEPTAPASAFFGDSSTISATNPAMCWRASAT